ncbi:MULTISPECIES: hypothetical protein [Stenotrophomonas]|uniref:hypothetical protein n=1 Tax=Stenotrophomonas TaxID=40323 RepID=UPI000DAA7D32|nr:MULTISPECIES: hypothetical protein [Stenotrophomonas]AYA90834.1 hypothetical protein PEM_08770 [Stenotrophomonas sp. Pemsol]MCU1006485.1 hypothetical protein [Stenotrophomonas maltophilia]PZS95326.1 hypothetical protein A7X90_01135 [Stenotrophomonas maltophilia]PZT19512.1 hypothetical protein A7X86_10065 [Stenotrophomonas maltophilia]PZT44622.1 hypothetical protein A7X99_03650 [Stenotrophomonas maltophilia]
MSRGGWARPVHRWTSIVFTLAVIANFAARGLGQGEPAAWITYSPLPPLFLQLFTGLYLFVLHYAGKRRSAALDAAG